MSRLRSAPAHSAHWRRHWPNRARESAGRAKPRLWLAGRRAGRDTPPRAACPVRLRWAADVDIDYAAADDGGSADRYRCGVVVCLISLAT